MRLSQLMPGSQAMVTKLSHQGALKNRLLDMGLYPGACVEMMLTAPFGDPIIVSVMGYELFLRKKEAENIFVRSLENASVLFSEQVNRKE